MSYKKHVVVLTSQERQALRERVRGGRHSAETLTRARVLLKADAAGPGWTDARIAQCLDVSVRMVEDVRKRFIRLGWEATVHRRGPGERPERRRLDGTGEARLVSLACSKPPEGHPRWTLDLLADRMVKLNYVPTVSRDTVWRVLKKTSLSLG